jgi:hypothetical protein
MNRDLFAENLELKQGNRLIVFYFILNATEGQGNDPKQFNFRRKRRLGSSSGGKSKSAPFPRLLGFSAKPNGRNTESPQGESGIHLMSFSPPIFHNESYLK